MVLASIDPQRAGRSSRSTAPCARSPATPRRSCSEARLPRHHPSRDLGQRRAPFERLLAARRADASRSRSATCTPTAASSGSRQHVARARRARRARLRDRPGPGHHRAQARPGGARLPGPARLAHRARATGAALLADLEQRVSPTPTTEKPLLLVLFDLDGFKAYNDTFGHPAGDALLHRLGHSLRDPRSRAGPPTEWAATSSACSRPHGQRPASDGARPRAARSSEHGEGFTITASYGSVLLPTEATSSAEALRMADQRMYARKSSEPRVRRAPEHGRAAEVLSERSPALGAHLDEVTKLCEAVGHKLGLAETGAGARCCRRPRCTTSARPRSRTRSSNKPGAARRRRVEFIRRHTGDRRADPVARPRRSTPAAQAGALRATSATTGRATPTACGRRDPARARIIAVCDAYDAMTSDRPYRERDELPRRDRGAAPAAPGSQFDPAVVDAFVEVMAGAWASAADRHSTVATRVRIAPSLGSVGHASTGGSQGADRAGTAGFGGESHRPHRRGRPPARRGRAPSSPACRAWSSTSSSTAVQSRTAAASTRSP